MLFLPGGLLRLVGKLSRVLSSLGDARVTFFFKLTGTWPRCPVEVWELYGRFGSDGVKNIGRRSLDPQASREAAKGRLRGVLPVASGPQGRYASYASQASDAIGSFEPAGRVADDARDATSKIPRPTAGDAPPHVP